MRVPSPQVRVPGAPVRVPGPPIDRILTISRVVIARIRGDPETRANLEMNGGGPIKIGAF